MKIIKNLILVVLCFLSVSAISQTDLIEWKNNTGTDYVVEYSYLDPVTSQPVILYDTFFANSNGTISVAVSNVYLYKCFVKADCPDSLWRRVLVGTNNILDMNECNSCNNGAILKYNANLDPMDVYIYCNP